MARIDRRINLSFKNTEYEVMLYEYIKNKGKIMGESAYIKTLVQRAIEEENKNNRP